jgi:hypothetical protein
VTLRGGSWNNNARNARAAYRNNNRPDNFNNNNGFRLVLARVVDDASGRARKPAHAPYQGQWQARPPK